VVKDASDRSTKVADLQGIPSEVGIVILPLQGGGTGSGSQTTGKVDPFVNVGGKRGPVPEGTVDLSLYPYSWRDGASP